MVFIKFNNEFNVKCKNLKQGKHVQNINIQCKTYYNIL